MDISAFSEENFVVQDWINETFRGIGSQENKEAFISSMVSKLQLYVQQVNSALEETSQQVLQNLPRVMHDADMIHKEALLLKDKMQAVKAEIAKIERDTGDSIAILEKLDNMKNELETAKQALHEADNWTVLATDIEDVFESHDIDAIASKVISMQQSLKVLSNSGDYEDRRVQLDGFKNRLEAIASPHLVKAFTNNNINESKKYVAIFTGMERLPQLVKYYAKCQKGWLCQEWRNLTDVDQDHGVAEWLKAFYDLLLTNWQTQVKWCQEVFGEWEIVAKIYGEVLISLNPGFTECIETALKQHDNPLIFLMQLKTTTQHFTVNLVNALNQQGGVGEDCLIGLYSGLYCVYKNHVGNYRELEEHNIMKELGEMGSCTTGGLVEIVQALGEATPRVVAVMRDAQSRCQEFTHGAAFPGLVEALQTCLCKYMEQYTRVLRQVDSEKSGKDEWTMFKVTLTLLQNAGELLMEVEQLDRDLVQGLLASSKNSKLGDIDMKPILLNKAALEQYNTLVNNIRNEASMLPTVVARLQDLCKATYQCMFDIMFTPISIQLNSARVSWAQESPTPHHMPDYSFAPMEYITQIGEYMMTLPQHLEPFVLKENSGLARALLCSSKSSNSEATAADLLLGTVARRTCSSYTDYILGIQQLSPNASKQLAIDIGYLGNVLEDLGFSLSDNLEQISSLIKLPTDSYQSQSSGCFPKLVATIRQMRNITSS